jgi:hypothetical protein
VLKFEQEFFVQLNFFELNSNDFIYIGILSTSIENKLIDLELINGILLQGIISCKSL